MFVPIVTLGLLGVTLTALLAGCRETRGAVDGGVATRIRPRIRTNGNEETRHVE